VSFFSVSTSVKYHRKPFFGFHCFHQNIVATKNLPNHLLRRRRSLADSQRPGKHFGFRTNTMTISCLFTSLLSERKVRQNTISVQEPSVATATSDRNGTVTEAKMTAFQSGTNGSSLSLNPTHKADAMSSLARPFQIPFLQDTEKRPAGERPLFEFKGKNLKKIRDPTRFPQPDQPVVI
jgi:hypothetical protein